VLLQHLEDLVDDESEKHHSKDNAAQAVSTFIDVHGGLLINYSDYDIAIAHRRA
jgi:hypothetical protein